jgi:hypothetical protein
MKIDDCSLNVRYVMTDFLTHAAEEGFHYRPSLGASWGCTERHLRACVPGTTPSPTHVPGGNPSLYQASQEKTRNFMC